MTIASTDYHDYVFRGGRLVGEFDAMYRNSQEVPWHQDELAHSVFSNIDVAILKELRPRSVCDVGCGLGHFTSRIRDEVVDSNGRPPDVTGIDISRTAIEKAGLLYAGIQFVEGDLLSRKPPVQTTFDVALAKDVLWYVCHRLDHFLDNLLHLSSRWIYIAQSFPEADQWVGKDVISGPTELLEILGRRMEISHTCIERDFSRRGRAYVHALGCQWQEQRSWS